VHGGTAGNNFLFAGEGAATLFGGGNNDQLYAYGELGQMLVGSVGFATLSAAFNWGDNTIKGGQGDERMEGGTGRDNFIAGAGNDTIFATDGERDTFTFIRNEAGGSALIQNIYSADNVRIDLVNYGCYEVRHALASQTTSGSSVTFSLTDGTEVTFENITSLSSRNFI
jgi:Ca2+-binding RTX toxin-like protein